MNPVGDGVHEIEDDSDRSDNAYFSTIGGDFAEDHKINRKSGNYINSHVLINSGEMALIKKRMSYLDQ
eukprot:8683544-Ditylum_brightwellii.AAC.1